MSKSLQRQTRELSRDQLLTLWEEIKAGKAADWSKGEALEYLIVRMFELEKASVAYSLTVPPLFKGGGDAEQLDGFVHSDGIHAIFEMKDYADRINVEPIAKLRNQLARRPAGVVGCVVSRSGFTAQAVMLTTYMAPQAILLWTGDEIEALLQTKFKIRRALRMKYARLLRDGMPYFDIRGELA